MSGDIGPNRSKYTHILRKKKTHIDELARQDWERPPFQWSIVPQGREGGLVLGGLRGIGGIGDILSLQICFLTESVSAIQSMHSLRERPTQCWFQAFFSVKKHTLCWLLWPVICTGTILVVAFEIQEGETMLFGQMWPDTDISKVKWRESAQRDREHKRLQVVGPLWVLC